MRLAVVYGSGASLDSGYRCKVTPPKRYGQPDDPVWLESPPIDRSFFADRTVWDLALRYPSVSCFIERYFGQREAGFSGPLGLEQVWSSVDLNHKHIRLETYDWISETNEYIQKNHFNVSNLAEDMDYLDLEPENRRFKFFGDCGRHLRCLIYRIYGEPELKSGARDNFLCFHEKLTSIRGVSVEYLTFNYDAFLEQSLSRGQKQFDYLADAESPSGRMFQRPGLVHILKLHGSLTWIHRQSDVRPIIYPNAFRGDPREFQAVRPRYEVDGALEEPEIIPPTWAKQDINDDLHARHGLARAILHQWRAALEVLKLANAVIIVGYSLPRVDFHVERLFRLALVQRDHSSPLGILHCTKPTNSDETGEEERFFQSLPAGWVKRVSFPNGFSRLCDEDLERVLSSLN